MSAASSASAATSAELMLARERAAMAAEDSQSFIAQRYFYRSAQLPLPDEFFDRNYTWQRAYHMQHRLWLDSQEAMRGARQLLQLGRHAQALLELETELNSEGEEAEEDAEMSTENEEAEEEAQMDSNPEVDDDTLEPPHERINQLVEEVLLSMAQPTAAPHVQAFTGRFYRLDTQ